LIELRGQNPGDDPVTFLSPWAGRYGLNPRQVYNLIQAGEAIIILEGFDELRNAGLEYDRYQHFNALWGMAFPKTKLIFTGRPNFFLDERERNHTLRIDENAGAADNAFTQLWELDRLTIDEIAKVTSGYDEAAKRATLEYKERGPSITQAARANRGFFEIVSRPSMLPVVVTIWPYIEEIQRQGYHVTSAVLLERYIKAVYERKEAEIDKTSKQSGASYDASHILLPKEIRDVFTAAVVWKMAGSDVRNTITRRVFNAVIDRSYGDVFKIFRADGVPEPLQKAVEKFEARFKEESVAKRRERVSTEIASTGLFVPDPAGGPDSLRFSHKQFYEYMIAKISWLILMYPRSSVVITLQSINDEKSVSKKILREDRSLDFLSQLILIDYSPFRRTYIKLFITAKFAVNKILKDSVSISYSSFKRITPYFPIAILLALPMLAVYGLIVTKLDGLIRNGSRAALELEDNIFFVVSLCALAIGITVVGFIAFCIIGTIIGIVGVSILRFIIEMYKPDKIIIVDRLLQKTYMPYAQLTGRLLDGERPTAGVIIECLRLIRGSKKSEIRRKFIKGNFPIPRASLPSIQLEFGSPDRSATVP
jgi:hypothetical protein